MTSGIGIIEEIEGEGCTARKGSRVSFECEGFLNRGDCIQRRIAIETIIGKRWLIAGLEKALTGMKPGGYRKVRIGPHLAYGEKGLPASLPEETQIAYRIGAGARDDLAKDQSLEREDPAPPPMIPPNAVLVYEIWVSEVDNAA